MAKHLHFRSGPPGYHCFGVMVLLALSLMAHAESSPWPEPVLADDELAQLRGGFLVGDLEIYIGLEQMVAVNGETLVVNRLTIPNLNQPVMPGDVEQVLETSLAVPVDLLPEGTFVQTDITNNSAILTRIQNSLDDTVIQKLQQLNIELNNIDPSQIEPGYRDTQYLDVLHLH